MINVCISCDENYAKYAGVVIASILANANSDDALTFYILDGGITQETKTQILELKNIRNCEINFIKIDVEMFKDYMNVKTHSYLTLPTYFRLKLPSILPDVSKIIYLDCDIVVLCSLRELFNIDIKDYPVAGVKDVKKKRIKENPTYVNSGMLVLNLDKMRELNLEQSFLDYTRKNIENITCGDQQIINDVLHNKIKLLDEEWNVQSSNFSNRSSYTKSPKIIHFTAKRKPWHFASFSVHKKYYFKYLQFTPWKLSEDDYKHWTKDNQIASIIEYIKYRPIFFLRLSFWKAVYYTYIK